MEALKCKGKWSIKRIITAITAFFVFGLGTYIVVADKTNINNYSIDVFDSLLMFLAVNIGITEFGKKLADKVIEDENK